MFEPRPRVKREGEEGRGRARERIETIPQRD